MTNINVDWDALEDIQWNLQQVMNELQEDTMYDDVSVYFENIRDIVDDCIHEELSGCLLDIFDAIKRNDGMVYKAKNELIHMLEAVHELVV